VLELEDARAKKSRTLEHTGRKLLSEPLYEFVVNLWGGLPKDYDPHLDIAGI